MLTLAIAKPTRLPITNRLFPNMRNSRPVSKTLQLPMVRLYLRHTLSHRERMMGYLQPLVL